MRKDINGNTPLHYAASYGHMEVIKFLISNSISTLEITNNDGQNAIYVAATEGHLNIIKYLVEKQGCSPYLLDKINMKRIHCMKLQPKDIYLSYSTSP